MNLKHLGHRSQSKNQTKRSRTKGDKREGSHRVITHLEHKRRSERSEHEVLISISRQLPRVSGGGPMVLPLPSKFLWLFLKRSSMADR